MATDTNKPEEIKLEDLTDVTGGAGWRSWVAGAGIGIGLWANGCAIGPMSAAPALSPSGYSILQK